MVARYSYASRTGGPVWPGQAHGCPAVVSVVRCTLHLVRTQHQGSSHVSTDNHRRRLAAKREKKATAEKTARERPGCRTPVLFLSYATPATVSRLGGSDRHLVGAGAGRSVGMAPYGPPRLGGMGGPCGVVLDGHRFRGVDVAVVGVRGAGTTGGRPEVTHAKRPSPPQSRNIVIHPDIMRAGSSAASNWKSDSLINCEKWL